MIWTIVIVCAMLGALLAITVIAWAIKDFVGWCRDEIHVRRQRRRSGLETK